MVATPIPLKQPRVLLLSAVLCWATALPGLAFAQDAPPRSRSIGVLLLAHGGDPSWDAKVSAVAQAVERHYPVEVAFGMATRRTIQEAIDGLVKRKVGEIVAVPLFISSHSSVVTSTEYLLGLRADAPADLAIFATMDHGAGGHHAHGDASHGTTSVDGTKPIAAPVPVRMTTALNDAAEVADILVDRATAISRDPASEVVVVVAHGPVPDDDNARWLDDIGRLVDRMRGQTRFARIDYLTVRDDADEPVKAAATAELRAVVSRGLSEGRRVLVVPLLLSYGGIEAGIRKRLEGLDVTFSPQALLPDDRIAAWVVARVGQSAPSSR